MPDAALTQAEVVDTPEASRYELRLGGRVIGFAAYRRRNDRIVFIHTEVDESYEGRGLGNRLAEAALEDVRGKGLVVVPLCPFIARYIQQHLEVSRPRGHLMRHEDPNRGESQGVLRNLPIGCAA